MADMNHSMNAEVTGDGICEESMELPIIISCLILLFRIISTVYVTGTCIAVIIVVLKEKNELKGRQVLLIVNLMVSGILSAINATIQSSVMIISYIAGVEDPIRCDMLFATLSTFHVNAFAFLMLSIDKYIAITMPLRYMTLLTTRVVYTMIFLTWGIAAFTSVVRLSIGDAYRKSSQYGVCIPKEESFISLMIDFIAPIFLSLLIALVIDIYLSILACKINRRLHQNRIEGLVITLPQNTRATSLRGRLWQKLDKITGYNIKPIIAVLVAIASSSLLGFIGPVLFITTQTLDNGVTYKFYTEHIIIPNAAYVYLIIQSMIYSLYFSKIRKPLCLMMRQLIRSLCPSCVRHCHWNGIIQFQRNRIAPVRTIEIESTNSL